MGRPWRFNLFQCSGQPYTCEERERITGVYVCLLIDFGAHLTSWFNADSEHSKSLQPIRPHAISVSPTGHVILTLDTLERAGPSSPTPADLLKAPVPGRDVLVWGTNTDGQLGNGKRSSLATPGGLTGVGDGPRFMLTSRKAAVNDLRGKLWKKGVVVEQVAAAGPGYSVVYWKIQ